MAQLRHNRLTYYRWEWHDPHHSEFWTACTISIYAPTYEMPFVSILVSLANGKGKVLMRAKSLTALPFSIPIPQEGLERLERAYTKAENILVAIRHDLRLVMGAHDLAPGARVIRDDTGEVIGIGEEPGDRGEILN